jgi:CheY-like chemotaxis protein
MEQPAKRKHRSIAGFSEGILQTLRPTSTLDEIGALSYGRAGTATNEPKSTELEANTRTENDPRETASGRKPYRILIADDHEALRRGLRSAMLGAGWQVVGEAADGLETVEKVKELVPDLVLLDLSMPVMNGHDAAREILRAMPGVKIVVFTMHESQQVRDALRKIGVHGLAVKSAPLSLLLDTIQNVLEDKKA